MGCELSYEAWERCLFVFNLQVAENDSQKLVEERLTILPEGSVETYVMPQTGNRCLRLEAGPGPLTLRYEAVVEHNPLRHDAAGVLESDVAVLPPDVLPYLYPSRYCEADRLGQLAAAEFGLLDRGHDRVTAICNWIYGQVNYVHGSSNRHTSALHTVIDREGVCRDFAHLGIALCRALGIPARYVSAYAWRLRDPDFHAVFEAYLGGRWYLFDPTRQAAIEGLVRIGIGRDAAEAAFADVVGSAELRDMTVHIEALDAGNWYVPTVDAVSVSAT